MLVTAAIIHEDQRILIAQRRMDSKNEAGKWEFPGGKVEFAESPEVCLIREIKEELGVDIRIERLFSVVSHVFQISGETRHLVLVCYLAELAIDQIPQPIEVEAFQWVDIAELERFDFASADVTLVQQLKELGQF